MSRKPARRRGVAGGVNRAKALRLARGGNPDDWNAWRRETDIFGDLLKNRVNLSEVDLPKIDLRGFLLVNVSFYKSNLDLANFSGTDCGYSDFHLARLLEAQFPGANLRNARLSRAYLRGANFDEADLRGADLRRASLTGASLAQADLRSVDLRSTRGLTQEQIDEAIGDHATRLPEHLRRPEAWARYDLEDEDEDTDLTDLATYPATVEVAVRGGQVELATTIGDAAFSSSIEPSVLRREILSSVARIAPRLANSGELGRAIENYKSELECDNYDVIVLGLRGVSLQVIFDEVSKSPTSKDDFDMMDDVRGALRAVLIQHFLFISQSHKWRAFLEQANQSPYRQEHAEQASEVGLAVSDVLDENDGVCDPQVPMALRRVIEELDISDDRQNLAVYNAFASVENTLRGIVSWVVRESARLGQDIWTNFKDVLAKRVGGAMATLVVALFGTASVGLLTILFPARFGWLRYFIDLLFS